MTDLEIEAFILSLNDRRADLELAAQVAAFMNRIPTDHQRNYFISLLFVASIPETPLFLDLATKLQALHISS